MIMSDIGVALSVLSNLQARSIQAERWYSSIGNPTERSRGVGGQQRSKL